MREEFERYRQLLKVAPGASPEEIRSAYRAAVKAHHPDTAEGDKQTAEQMFMQLTQAYRALYEEATRRERIKAESVLRGLSPRELAAQTDDDAKDRLAEAGQRRRRRARLAAIALGVALPAAGGIVGLTLWQHGGRDTPEARASGVPVALPQSTLRLADGVAMTILHLPAGSFRTPTPHRAGPKGASLRPVTVPKGFGISRTEVTQAQWEAAMETRPWQGKPHARDGADLPVTYVSFYDAERFCARLSERVGRKVRLPTEIEWEYACRAGSDGEYCFGDANEPLGEHAWFAKNAFLTDQAHVHPVAGRKPNAWGLYDVHGNVWEWCYDELDPYGPNSIRGGSWVSEARYCRAAFRGQLDLAAANYDVGFRVVVEGE